MALGLGLAPMFAKGGVGTGVGGVATVSAPFANVSGPSAGSRTGAYDAWSVDGYTGGALPSLFTVRRGGFDTAGAIATYDDLVAVQGTIASPWPNQATPMALWALSEYVYPTDTIFGGAANLSTIAAPKVVARWAGVPKQVLGVGLDIEVLAFVQFGRNLRPCACVKITGTPTTGTAVTKTATFAKSSTDNLPVFKSPFGDSDFPSNGNAAVTFTFEAFPFVGDTAAKRDTSAGTFPTPVDLSPQVYQTVGGTIRHIFVDGVGAAPATSTVEATARTTPYATVTAAMTAAYAAATAGNVSGYVITVLAGTHTWDGTAPTGGTRVAPDTWFVVRGDPLDANPRVNCVLSTSTTTYKRVFNNIAGSAAWLKFSNIGITMALGFAGFFEGFNLAWLWFDYVSLINNFSGSNPFSSNTPGMWVTNSSGIANVSTGTLFATSAANRRIILARNTTSNRVISGNCIAGCTVDGTSITGECWEVGSTVTGRSNLILFNCKVTNWLGTSSVCTKFINDGGTPSAYRDIAVFQCDFDCSTSATVGIIAMGENEAHDILNVWWRYITVTGGSTAQNGGRLNTHNDPTTLPTTAVSDQCLTINHSVRQSILTLLSPKDDVYHGTIEADAGAGFLLDGIAKRNAVGRSDNDSTNTPDLFPPDITGLNSTRANAVTFDGQRRPTAGNRQIAAGAVHQAIEWDIDGVTRRIDGTGANGAREAP